jgi:hypothetical protein
VSASKERRQGVPENRAGSAAASFVLYAVITAVLGRDVISQIGTVIAHDPGDPLLTAAILHWNAHHVPWTDAWWQFPIFYPTRDALAFSEHLLGLSVIASPIEWIGGNPLATYNITMLLTFPLSGIAMYALAHRLTGSAVGAFVAGLAFAFAPYRISHLPHIQILALFWAPLSLLGLHAFLDSRERGGGARVAWLALFGAAWALQGASNGYALVFFTIFIGLWVMWFVVARGRWRDLGAIAIAAAVASVPLIPILRTYVTVHARHGFERSLAEMRGYSADVAAMLCAPETLSLWGWVKVACRGEGELFPGVATFGLFVGGVVSLMRVSHIRNPAVRIASRILTAGAVVYASLVALVAIAGPMRIEAGILRLSLSSLDKLLLIALAAGVVALLISLAARARSSVSSAAFYAFAAVTTWLLALGPTVTLGGTMSGRPGPFTLLSGLPGVTGLRVPARFWMMTMLCLAVVAGFCAARIVAGRSRRVTAVAALMLGVAVVADGWTSGIPAQPAPAATPDASILRGQTVLMIPVEPFPDIGATWLAVTEGWRAVNGYSGNMPRYYDALASAAVEEDPELLEIFRERADLHVVVRQDAALKSFVERQPGAIVTATGPTATQYRLPRRSEAAALSVQSESRGARVPIASVESPCMPGELSLLEDGDEASRWACPSRTHQQVTIDTGQVQQVGAVLYGLGPYHWEYATQLSIETSVDGETWIPARSGSVLGDVIRAGLLRPQSIRAMVPFAPRPARFLRVRPVNQKEEFTWTIAELEVWSGR